MIDIESEELIPLADVPALKCLPKRRKGSKLNIRTISRWTTIGLRGITLEVVRVGGSPCTTKAALLRFFERLATPNTPNTVTPSQQRAAQDRANAILSNAGI